MLNRYIEYCRECADKAFQTWEGWPNKTPVPSLPLVQDNGCAECGSTVGVSNDQIVWVNIGMGLPDHWILYARDSVQHGQCGLSGYQDKNPDFYLKWGGPYCYEDQCPKCNQIAPVSMHTANPKNRKYALNCKDCGIVPVKSPLEIPNFDQISSDYERWLEDTSDDSLGLSIINTEGYLQWYAWMEKHQPDKLL